MTKENDTLGNETVKVRFFKDQRDRRLIMFSQGNKTAYIYPEEFAGNVNVLASLLPLLAKRGITLLKGRQDLLLAVQQLGEPEGVLVVADRPGWIKSSSFAYASGTVCTSGKRGQAAVIAFDRKTKFGCSGTHKEWSDGLRAHIDGNTVLQFLLSLGLTPVLLSPFGPALDLPGNIAFQMYGRSTVGKTTGARLAGSMWGDGADGSGNYIETWRTTMNGLETTMQAHADALLILDEANLAGSSPAERSRFQSEAVMMLDTGRTKGRFGGSDTNVTRLTVISTSNEPLTGTTKLRGADTAVQVRMPSLDVGSRPYGILDRPGEAGAEATIAAIKATIRNHHGWGARQFVRAVTLQRHRSEADLGKSLAESAETFKRIAGFCGLPPQQQRVCKTFAFIHATGHLAAECGAIPLTVEQVLSATLSVYREVAGGGNFTKDKPIVRFEAALRALRSDLEEPSQLATARLGSDTTCLGHIRLNKANGVELLVVPGPASQQLGLLNPTLAALREAGALVVDDRHFGTYRTGFPNRIYVIRIDASHYPQELRVFQAPI